MPKRPAPENELNGRAKTNMNTKPEPFDPAAPSLPLRRHLSSSAALPPGAAEAPRHTLDFRSSDATLDRYEEVISVAGWRLENYRRNPVVQNAHSYASLADTIGRSLITEA